MTEYFAGVPQIRFEGPRSDNPLAYHHYDPAKLVEGKSMRNHLRFSVAYWHAFCNGGADQFGLPTRIMPWNDPDPMQTARNKVDACFEFCTKLGLDYYCFHDNDVAPEGETLAESFANFDTIVALLKAAQQRTGVKPLWLTANLFSNPRFMHGAATSPNPDAFAYAAAKVAKTLDAALELGAQGFTFWGGREGYKSLLNTNLRRELDHLARFLHLAVDYKHKIGFTGQFYIEPKPKEPTKHQYDSDAAACYAFLQRYDLTEHFKLNLEANHANLAGHTFHHELAFAAACGILGSVDANRGDLLLGWDTDQFPTDLYDTTFAMLTLLDAGGFTTGGLNFDAHVHRESIEPVDLVYAHVGAMDAFARGLEIAARIRAAGVLGDLLKARYMNWDTGLGKKIEENRVDFDDLRTLMLKQGEISPNPSGRVELLENLINTYIA